MKQLRSYELLHRLTFGGAPITLLVSWSGSAGPVKLALHTMGVFFSASTCICNYCPFMGSFFMSSSTCGRNPYVVACFQALLAPDWAIALSETPRFLSLPLTEPLSYVSETPVSYLEVWLKTAPCCSGLGYHFTYFIAVCLASFLSQLGFNYNTALKHWHAIRYMPRTMYTLMASNEAFYRALNVPVWYLHMHTEPPPPLMMMSWTHRTRVSRLPLRPSTSPSWTCPSRPAPPHPDRLPRRLRFSHASYPASR